MRISPSYIHSEYSMVKGKAVCGPDSYGRVNKKGKKSALLDGAVQQKFISYLLGI